MRSSILVALALFLALAPDAEAGRRGFFGRRGGGSCGSGSCGGGGGYSGPSQSFYGGDGSCGGFQPMSMPMTQESSQVVTPQGVQQFSSQQFAANDGSDALAEVNARRAGRGLRPYMRDEGLTQAARACAQYRARFRIEGHTRNDFAFVPAGTFASSAGCAAWPQGMGWGSCCTYDGYTYAGAAWAVGADGQRYMHLFVR